MKYIFHNGPFFNYYLEVLLVAGLDRDLAVRFIFAPASVVVQAVRSMNPSMTLRLPRFLLVTSISTLRRAGRMSSVVFDPITWISSFHISSVRFRFLSAHARRRSPASVSRHCSMLPVLSNLHAPDDPLVLTAQLSVVFQSK